MSLVSNQVHINLIFKNTYTDIYNICTLSAEDKQYILRVLEKGRKAKDFGEPFYLVSQQSVSV